MLHRKLGSSSLQLCVLVGRVGLQAQTELFRKREPRLGPSVRGSLYFLLNCTRCLSIAEDLQKFVIL